MLDANTCIYLLSDSQPLLTQRVAECDAGSLCVSAIVVAEVAHGSAMGKAPTVELLDAFLSEIPMVPFDEAAARAYSTLTFRRGSFDRLIAAHALSLGLTLVTSNIGDFSDVPGLVVENWTVT